MTRPHRGSRPRSSPESDAQSPPATAATSRRYVVDRIEGQIAVLEDADAAGNVVNVKCAGLPSGCVDEGAFLVVPIGQDGTPQWDATIRDRAEEKRRRDNLASRLEQLQRNDDGGDLAL